MYPFTPALLASGMSYAQYRALTEQLVAQGRTTGPDQSQAMLDYTRLSWQRMKRAEQQTQLDPQVVLGMQQITQAQHWVVLTEAWCGDAAQNLPVIAALAAQNPNITLHLLLRDEHPAVMDAYLTAGSRSIPKMIVLDADLHEIGTWGPRPAPAQALLYAWKAQQTVPKDEFYKQLQQWYNADRGHTLQQEILSLATHNTLPT